MQNKKERLKRKYIMYLSQMKNGQISTCQRRTVRRLGSGKHGMADTQKTDVSVYTQKEIHRERTNMSNLIPFFSEYRYLWSAHPPISHLPWNARANAYRDHRVPNI